MLEHGLGRSRLEIEPDIAGLEMQNAHVGLEVAFAVEQGRVTAALRRQGLDVVGELTLEILGRVWALDQQHGPFPAQIPGLLAQGSVLAVELYGRGGLGHRSIVGGPLRGLTGSSKVRID